MKNISQQQYDKLVHHNIIQKQEKIEDTSNTSEGEQNFLFFFDLDGVHFYKYVVILALFNVKITF